MEVLRKHGPSAKFGKCRSDEAKNAPCQFAHQHLGRLTEAQAHQTTRHLFASGQYSHRQRVGRANRRVYSSSQLLGRLRHYRRRSSYKSNDRHSGTLGSVRSLTHQLIEALP
jgi:hypothetical protein